MSLKQLQYIKISLQPARLEKETTINIHEFNASRLQILWETSCRMKSFVTSFAWICKISLQLQTSNCALTNRSSYHIRYHSGIAKHYVSIVQSSKSIHSSKMPVHCCRWMNTANVLFPIILLLDQPPKNLYIWSISIADPLTINEHLVIESYHLFSVLSAHKSIVSFHTKNKVCAPFFYSGHIKSCKKQELFTQSEKKNG